MTSDGPIRFRHHAAATMAGVVITFASTTIATYAWWTLPLLAIPSAFTWWSFHSRTDVDKAGLAVRGWGRSRRLAWSQVRGISVEGQRVYAELTDDTRVRLPAVRGDGVSVVLALATRPAAP